MKEQRWREAINLLKNELPLVEKQWELMWNLGWCYFKLGRMDEARKYLVKSARSARRNHLCKFALGQVYLKTKEYKKAERILSEALQIKGSYVVRLGLALAYLAQGKFNDAERMHLTNIELGPKKSERYEAYADFLSDIGRQAEAEEMYRKAGELRGLN